MPSISRYIRITVTTDRGSEREARKVLDDVLKSIPKGYNYADLGRVKGRGEQARLLDLDVSRSRPLGSWAYVLRCV